MSGERVEWRGDLFATDLAAVTERITGLPVIARRFEHTVTVFLHADGWELDGAVRLRAYRDLPEVSERALATVFAQGLPGKLQRKRLSGATVQLGKTVLVGGSGAPRCHANGRAYVARSVRVSRRVHHTFAHGGADVEARRVTVDLTRDLFRFGDDGALSYLGSMGPRVEVKGPDAREVGRLRRALDPAGSLRRVPYGGVELLFQDLLCDRVQPDEGPEVEAKLDVAGTLRAEDVANALAALGDLSLLLPAPYAIARMRRYHVCHDAGMPDECTVVETTAGRLSAKRKRHARADGPVLLRDTLASRTTDRDGELVPVDRFQAERGWVCVNTFDKVQLKIPFALPSGRAYLMSVDRCRDAESRRMEQVELEFIGTVGAVTPQASARPVSDELDTLVARMVASQLGPVLTPSTRSKHEVFSAPLPREGDIEHRVKRPALAIHPMLPRDFAPAFAQSLA